MITVENKSGERNHVIDLLRFVAVLFVLLDHIDLPFMENGWIGVDVFFVISGYVIVASLQRRDFSMQPNLILRCEMGVKFVIDRLARLLPSLALTVTLGLAAAALLDVPAEFGNHFLTGLASLVGQANIVLSQATLDYFGPNIQRNIFMHLWSLGVEFQFYFLIALIFVLLPTSAIPYFLSGLGITSIVLWANNDFIWSYAIQLRFWEFFVGVFCFGTRKLFPPPSLNSCNYAIALGIASLAVSLFAEPVGMNIFLCVLGTVLLLLHAEHLDHKVQGLLKYVAHVGRASYSIYLYHWVVVWVFNMTAGLDNISYKITGIFLSFALGILNYRYFERPLTKLWSRNHKSRSFTNVFIITVWLAASLFCFTNNHRLKQISNAGFQRLTEPFHSDIYTPLILSSAQRVQIMKPDRCHYSNPEDLTNDLFIRTCLERSPTRLPFIYLIGDSHASMLRHGLEEALNKGVHSRFGYIHNNLFNNIVDSSAYKAPEIEYILKNARRGDTIMFTFYRGKLNFQNALYSGQNDLNQKAIIHFQEWFFKIVPTLLDAQLKVILILDGPRLALNVRADVCDYRETWSGKNPCALRSKQSKKGRFGQETVFNGIRERYPNVILADYHDYVCKDICSHRDDAGMLIMYDSNHITKAQSLRLSTFWRELLQ